MNKKILAILIVLICALSISTVSAADSADSSADDSFSFTKLNGDITKAKEGDTVELTNDYKYNSNVDNSPIGINKNLTIDGKGHTIDATGKVSVFTIGEGKNVIIKDITFINGNSTSSCIDPITGKLTTKDVGGVITNNGILTLINCNFINNTAYARGGAVYNNGTLTVDNCVFDGNNVIDRTYNVKVLHGGAAIYSTYDTTTNIMNSEIKNSVNDFIWKDSKGKSDCLYAAIFAIGNLTISDCKFTDNYGRYGGAVYTGSDNFNNFTSNDPITFTTIIKDSTFSGNVAVYGGAIEQCGNVVVTISNCNFTENGAAGKGDMSPNDNNGGAVCVSGGTAISIENCNFNNNSGQYGGVMDIACDNIAISDSIFTNNTAEVRGGAIILGSHNGATISDCSFTNNSAKNGGAMAIGCGVNDNSNNATISDCSFTNNSATGNGGAIDTLTGVGTVYNLTISDCSFKDNSATGNGGAISSKNVPGSVYTLTISESSFINNSAASQGGAIWNTMNTTVVDSVFANNNATMGADIAFTNETSCGSINLDNVISDGEGIYVESAKAPINITNTVLATEMKLNKVENVTIGEDVVISGKVTVVGSEYPKVNGTVAITIDGVNEINVVEVVDGKFTADIESLPVGIYNATLLFTDKDYISSNATTKFTVNKIATTITINSIDKIKVGDNITVSGTTTGIANNTNITITVNGKEYDTTVVDGKFSEKINNLTPEGTAKVVVSYVGNDTVDSAEDTINVTVGRDSSIIEFNNITAIVGENVIVSGTIIPKVANFTITANGKNYKVSVSNGIFSLDIGNFKNAGDQIIIAKYDGNEDYTNATVKKVITVVKKATKITVGDIIGVAGDIVIKGNVTGIPEGAVINITIAGKNYNTTVKDSKFSATIELAAGNYNIIVNYAGDDVYAPANATAKLSLTQIATNIIMSDLNVLAGQNVTIAGNVTGIPEGAVIIISIAGKNYNTIVKGSKFSATIDLAVGNYNITAKYEGNITYKAANASAKLTINKINASIVINPIGKIAVGDNITVSGTTTGIANNTNITITVNGKEYNAIVVDGKFSEKINNLTPEGTVKVVVSYGGNDNVTGANATINVTVGRDSSIIEFNNITAIVGENVIVSGTIIPKVANFTITVDGKVFNVTAKDGKFSVNIGNFTKAGNYTIVADYDGNKNYTNITVSDVFTVEKKATSIAVGDVNGTAGDKIVINGTVTGIPEGATLTITVGTATVTAKVNGSKFSAVVDGQKAGNYNITVNYAGDDVYAPANATAKLSLTQIGATLTVPDITLFFKNGTQLMIYLTSNGTNVSDEKVTININGVNYTRTIKNGTAKFDINLAPGTYTVTVSLVSEKYGSISTNATVTVLSVIKGNDTVLFFKNGTRYVALFLDGKGNPLVGAKVQFNINGIFYDRTTNENGTTNITINLGPGNYIITAINAVNGALYANNITVLPTIISENIVKYYKNETQYVVKVVDGKGIALANQTVEYNINGVFYKRTTDVNGIATFNINLAAGNSKPQEYIITAWCNGCIVSNNITVLPVLTAKDFNESFEAGKKFIANIVDGKGNPLAGANIQFNINGIFYNKISDVNGTVGLNINLAPGEYIITGICKDNGAVISNNVTVTPKKV